MNKVIKTVQTLAIPEDDLLQADLEKDTTGRHAYHTQHEMIT